MFGAWGDSIPASTGLLQLRALDWVTDGKVIFKFHFLLMILNF
jgi:hypothetical protein